ncbi:MAG: WD40/YVTN/BNR-like repeat-containing protein [Thermomicrobiales bacterium]
MAKVASPPQPKNQRERMQQQARHEQRKRRTLLAGATTIAVLGIAIGIWAIAARVGSGPDARALSQFHTPDIHSLSFDPGDANTIFFGHHTGLKISHDAGRTWQDVSVGNVDAMQLAMPAAGGERRYLAGHNVFMVSTDGGKTWRNQPTNLPGLDLHTFAASPSDPLRLYTAPAGFSGLFTSTDGGAQWQQLPLPSGGSSGMGLAVAPDSPLHLYAGIGTRIAESRDGGKTWAMPSGPTAESIQLAVDPSGVLYAGTVQGLAKRAPDGTWHTLALPSGAAVFAIAVSPTQPNRVAVVDQQGDFYRSDDGARTWVPA